MRDNKVEYIKPKLEEIKLIEANVFMSISDPKQPESDSMPWKDDE